KIMEQLIYKNGCWSCKRAQADPQQKYVFKYQKNNEEYKKIVLKMSNDLAGEEVFYSGFLKELDEQKP
ncbi:11616_t:CDS:2, partial [Funneliformis geosporum]